MLLSHTTIYLLFTLHSLLLSDIWAVHLQAKIKITKAMFFMHGRSRNSIWCDNK